MGSHKSKEDDVSKISTSIFITNLPVMFSAKDLFNACKQYGHVVDAYIPIKRSKAEKRTPLNKKNHQPNNYVGVNRRSTHVYQKDMGQSGVGNSYVQVVKGNNTSVVAESDHTPTLGERVCSLSNLRLVLHKEGFDNIKIQYMGELWVLVEFDSEASKKLFHANVEIEGIPFKLWSNNTFKRIASKWGDLLHIDDQDENCFHSKRLCIKTKVGKNIIKAFKIIFRGKVCWIRAKEVTGWVPDFLEESDDEHDSDDDNSNKPEELSTGQKENHSKDPFNIYELLNKKKDNVESEDKSEHSPQYPPGYTPKDGIETFCNNGENSKKECGEFSQGGHEEGVGRVKLGGILCCGILGEVIIMGDFNEVRCKSERFGSNFNVQGANVFNSFIVNAGLEEIPLGGCSFTWCHKSATKMSKLDRFLIYENLMITCPNFTATSLERYLSDHRPILLRSKVGGSMHRIQAWNEVVDRVYACLSKWKMKTLSIGGRLTSIHLGTTGKAIHGEDGKVGKQVKSTFPSYWMDIVHEINVLKNQGINLLNCMQMKLGNGDKTAFWEDIWIGHIVLKDLYPRIYALETYRWKWSLENSGDFSVASVRKMLDDKMLPDVTTKTRWIKLVPIKVNVHAWKVKIDSLPTRFNISRRGMDIESITCSICDNEVESSSHLFFKCNMVRDIIRKITRWWDITYIEADSYEDWLNWLVNLRLSSNYKQALEGVFYVMWWHVWQYRNKYIFEAVSSPKTMIFEDIVSQYFYWCRNRCKASFS
ncbi:RNA-directed DNA polymerase, eukaryota [Tanacetum coccineum]